METRIQYFETIPSAPRREEILARLGYQRRRTILTARHQEKLDQSIRRGLSLCHLKGAYGRNTICEHGNDYIKIENQEVLKSASLTRLVCNSSEIVFMAATVGAEIVDIIHNEVMTGDATQGVIMDAVASETADNGLDWLMAFLNRMLAKGGKRLTKHRYSPGYGDLSLENQKLIFNILDLTRLGLTLNESCILLPEKSVLAVAGIESIAI